MGVEGSKQQGNNNNNDNNNLAESPRTSHRQRLKRKIKSKLAKKNSENGIIENNLSSENFKEIPNLNLKEIEGNKSKELIDEMNSPNTPVFLSSDWSPHFDNNINNNNNIEDSFDSEDYFDLLLDSPFDKIEYQELIKIFQECGGSTGTLDKINFNKLLGKLEQFGVNDFQDSAFSDRLFHIFDINHDGVIDSKEFISGIGLICKGTEDEKLELTFNLYDLDGNGSISKNEIIEVFSRTYESKLRAIAALSNPSNIEIPKIDMQVEQFNKVLQPLLDSAFERLDIDGNGCLSLAEFKIFALKNPKVCAELNGYKSRVRLSLL